MKGHKDSSGKFHPHSNSPQGTKASHADIIKFKKPVDFKDAHDLIKHKLQSRPEQKVTDIVSFNELDESAKEKAREWYREAIGGDAFADSDGIIYDEKTKIADYDVFSNYDKKYYDLDRGQYIQFPDLQVKDEKKLFNMLGLPNSLIDKVEISFQSQRGNNTNINFYENESGVNLAIGMMDYNTYKTDTEKFGEKPMTNKEFYSLVDASEKWDDLMHNTWKSLRDNYDYTMSDEGVDEGIEANGYTFDREGNRENV